MRRPGTAGGASGRMPISCRDTPFQLRPPPIPGEQRHQPLVTTALLRHSQGHPLLPVRRSGPCRERVAQLPQQPGQDDHLLPGHPVLLRQLEQAILDRGLVSACRSHDVLNWDTGAKSLLVPDPPHRKVDNLVVMFQRPQHHGQPRIVGVVHHGAVVPLNGQPATATINPVALPRGTRTPGAILVVSWPGSSSSAARWPQSRLRRRSRQERPVHTTHLHHRVPHRHRAVSTQLLRTATSL